LAHRLSRGGPRYLLSPALLVQALYEAKAVYGYSSGAKALAGYAFLAAFAVCYLVALPQIEKQNSLVFWAFLLDRYRAYYNHVRPHRALGRRTPAQALRRPGEGRAGAGRAARRPLPAAP
jgi:transposase InsO family protein